MELPSPPRKDPQRKPSARPQLQRPVHIQRRHGQLISPPPPVRLQDKRRPPPPDEQPVTTRALPCSNGTAQSSQALPPDADGTLKPISVRPVSVSSTLN